MKHIAILDFGSQYTHLIARRIREQKVLAKIYPSHTKSEDLPSDVTGIILSGGPQSVFDDKSPKVDLGIFNLNKPILGLCYGHQLISHILGGEVVSSNSREYGYSKFILENKTALFKNISPSSTVWMSHGDSVIKVPEGFTVTGSTTDCPITAIANDEKKNLRTTVPPRS